MLTFCKAWVTAILLPCCLISVARAQQRTYENDLPSGEAFLGLSTIPIWEKNVPGAIGTNPSDQPTLTMFRPRNKITGTAVIIAPGGAYRGLASDLEGREVADWFTARGVVAFVLRYRLGAKYLYPIPLEDAQRAIRLVRYRAREFRIAPERVGMMGFSAGGHLTAAAGTLFDNGKADAPDAIDRVSSRPDFLILGYAWLNAMQPNAQGFISYCSVLKTVGPEKCRAFAQEYTPELHVTAQTPPAFLYHTSNDATVPVDASVSFYRALQAAGVPAELHIFENGPHGSGLGQGDPALDLWPMLLEAWMRGRGLLTPAAGLPSPAN
ncbi:MAG: alpha/beta hydrolase [Acidobacteriaceae bacterium]|nr:alpha/beta hydrolase [Acidobacteriaceae bacterium]